MPLGIIYQILVYSIMVKVFAMVQQFVNNMRKICIGRSYELMATPTKHFVLTLAEIKVDSLNTYGRLWNEFQMASILWLESMGENLQPLWRPRDGLPRFAHGGD